MSKMLTIYIENLELSIKKIHKAKENIKICISENIDKYKTEADNAYTEANKLVSIFIYYFLS